MTASWTPSRPSATLAPSFVRELPAAVVRLDDDDVLEAARPQADDGHRSDRAAAEDEPTGPARAPETPIPCSADGERLDQRAVGELDLLREPPEHLGRHGEPLGVAAVVGPEADPAPIATAMSSCSSGANG